MIGRRNGVSSYTLMNQNHYLGFERFAGRGVRYIFEWRGHWVGLADWQSGAFKCRPRDRWMDLSFTVTDATIAMFKRLTGQLFSRCRNRQDEVWRMGKALVGKLMQFFVESIDAMARAFPQQPGGFPDPQQGLDEK